MDYQHSNVPSSSDPFERYGASSPGLRFGSLIRHNGKLGGWSVGINNDRVELGACYVVPYEETHVGFVKWTDAEPDQVVVPLRSNPDLRALRESLGDLDLNFWGERTAKGKPRDPWRPSILMPFVKPETLDGFTFSTSSDGGVRAARHLIRTCVAERRSFPEATKGKLPLVKLGEMSYLHSDRQFGKLFNPVLEVDDWVPAVTIAETLQRMGVEVPAIEHKAKTIAPAKVKPAKRTGPMPWDTEDDSEPDVTGGSYDED